MEEVEAKSQGFRKQIDGLLKEIYLVQEKYANALQNQSVLIEEAVSKEANRWRGMLQLAIQQRKQAQDQLAQYSNENSHKPTNQEYRQIQNLVRELQNEIKTVRDEKLSYEITSQKEIQSKNMQISQKNIQLRERDIQIESLMSKLRQLKDDNNFLLQKLSPNLPRSNSRGTLSSHHELYPVSPVRRDKEFLAQSSPLTPLKQNIQKYPSTIPEKVQQNVQILNEYNKLLKKFNEKQKQCKEIQYKLKEIQIAIEGKNDRISFLEQQNHKISNTIQDNFVSGKQSDRVQIEVLKEKLFQQEQLYAGLHNKYMNCLDIVTQLEHKLKQLQRRKTDEKQGQQIQRELSLQLQQLQLKYSQSLTQNQQYIQQLSLLQKELTSLKQLICTLELQNQKLQARMTSPHTSPTLTKLLSLLGLPSLKNQGDILEVVFQGVQRMKNKLEHFETENQLLGKENCIMKQKQKQMRTLLSTWEHKCKQLQIVIVTMQQAHKDKLILVKEDYDILYAKYLKYRNMVLSKQSKQKSQDKN